MLDEIQKDVELAYCDRFGRRNIEYISLGCDILPVLCGRSPIQVYADFMRDFRDTFRALLGVIITVRFYDDFGLLQSKGSNSKYYYQILL